LRRAAFLFCNAAQNFLVFCARKRLRKNLNSDDHFDRSFAPYRIGSQTIKKKEKTMNPLTQLKKLRIVPLLIALMLVALAPMVARANAVTDWNLMRRR
jgi:hypothetical protein